MPDVNWTESQKDAISARQGTILVAAAAGSGKTAVLVERAIERLTDREHPTTADKMLIVTFTKAAAAEMRARLEKRLTQMLRENPGDRHLRRQSILLSQAHIGTVDSFCSEMVREFFHLLDISPDFKIMTDKQGEELMNAAINEAVSAAFESGKLDELADAFATERSDDSLAKMTLTLYKFMQSHPFPEKWLRKKAALYSNGDTTLWEGVILEYARETMEHCVKACQKLADEAAEIATDPDKLYRGIGEVFAAAAKEDSERLQLLKAYIDSGDWDMAAAFLTSLEWAKRKNAPRGSDKLLTERLNNARKRIKDSVEGLKKYLACTREQCSEELRRAAPLIEALTELTLDFTRRFDEKKRSGNFLDYSDLEHFAIKLFLNEDGSRTDTAAEVSCRFDEIMIDEFQDTNEVQESIFTAISKNSENLFMVGDVKQSIYGFRRAAPEIFLEHRASYQKYDRTENKYPAYIVLDRNFRSRREVTDTVNFVFSRLMSKKAGGIDYTGEERLVCGADYSDKPGCETEMVFISTAKAASSEVAEAQWIGRKIREMIAEGFTVTDKGGERPANYGDFCILHRRANKTAHTYAEELKKLGIPARASVSEGFFSAAEIKTVLSLLQVIDNPNQDIPLLAVLMSPIYGFSADDAAELRAENKKVPIYVSLTRAARTDERCKKILHDLVQYRNIAATMPADSFLTLLYEKTGCTDMVLAMENGTERIQNLRLLEAYAKEYEGSGYHGISGFVRFLENLSRSDSDLQSGEASPDGSSCVSVMSIHKSKGLEFPVCIVAGCGKEFFNDKRPEVILHPELGLGVKLKDQKHSARRTTTAREAIDLENSRSAAAEELRVLYVAMTRAKEKLFMLGSCEDAEKKVSDLSADVSDGGISPYVVRKAKSVMQWLMLCSLCHPNGTELRRVAMCDSTVVCHDDYTPWNITLYTYDSNDFAVDVPAAEDTLALPDTELEERLRHQIAYAYPYESALGVPAKVAASKLAAEQGAKRKITLSRPAWLGEKGMTPAERGTALHEFMQFADFHAMQQDPRAEVERLVSQAYLSPEQAAAVDLSRVRAFIESDLGRRVLASPHVERERRFTAEIPATLAKPQAHAEETVVLQGAVDCIFVENGRLHIIDFKTDRVKTIDELWGHYAPQLKLYAAAMEEVTSMQVGEMILYSTHLNAASSKIYSRDE